MAWGLLAATWADARYSPTLINGKPAHAGSQRRRRQPLLPQRRQLYATAAHDKYAVALETGVVWLYSISVVLWPQAFPTMARHLYFEGSTMLIGLINLGHALVRLLDLTPPSARVVVDDREHLTPLAQVAPVSRCVYPATTGYL